MVRYFHVSNVVSSLPILFFPIWALTKEFDGDDDGDNSDDNDVVRHKLCSFDSIVIHREIRFDLRSSFLGNPGAIFSFSSFEKQLNVWIY